MKDLGLTHVESLDSEQITIPGLDIDSALATTIELGKKKLRNRRIITASSTLAGVLVVGLSFFSLFLDFRNPSNPDNNQVATSKTSKIKTKVKGTTTVKNTTPAVTTATQISSKTAIPKPVAVVPNLVPIMQYGNSNLCIPKTVNENGIDIGTSISSSQWNPPINGTTTVRATRSGNTIGLQNIASNQATNGAYVNMISGFSKPTSYANITTLGFTYCEVGYKLTITSRGSQGGYFVNEESW